MIPDRRQRILLAVLLLILIVFGGSRLRQWLSSLGAGEVFGLRARRPDVSAVLQADVAVLDRTESANFVPEFTPGRNPWTYGRKPTPPPPPPPPPVEKQPEVVKPRDLAPVVPRDPTPVKPTPPPIDVEYIGSFGPRNRKIAVFETGETTINAQEGDVVNRKFRVYSIGFESVDLTFEGFPDEPPQRVALRGMDP